VGYSYNGAVLLKLPEWDKGNYPYAIIVEQTSALTKTYKLELTQNPPYRHEISIRAPEGSFIVYKNVDGNDYWVKSEEFESTTMILWDSHYSLIWASHDVLKADNSVYLAASEPVPVYE